MTPSVTHAGWIRRHLGRSLRVRLGMLLLAFAVLPAIFAEFVAADAPLFAWGPGGVTVLPAIVEPEQYRERTAQQIAEYHAQDLALWPAVRYGPDRPDPAAKGNGPSWRHPFGTDAQGRDLFARVIYGARVALGLTAAVLLLALGLGVLFGAMAGYLGGIWEEALARPIEFVHTFPTIVVVAVVRAIDPDGSWWSLALAIVAVRWAEIARIVRAEVIRLYSADFVNAARAVGCSRRRIVWRHIMPHATGPVLVSLMFTVGSVICLEAAVSFLGLGLSGSWGVLIAEGLGSQASLAPTVIGLMALTITMAAAYLLADAAGEAYDSRVAACSRSKAFGVVRGSAG